MAVKNRAHFKDIFKSGYKIKEEDYVDWLDSFRHKEDPIQLSDAEGLEAFLEPYRRNDETIPVAEVDGIGDLISSYLQEYLTSSSTVEQSQVKGLEDALSNILSVVEIENIVDSKLTNAVVPEIGGNGNWVINGEDTGISAVGKDGDSPRIGSNDNWWLGDVDMGVRAVWRTRIDYNEDVRGVRTGQAGVVLQSSRAFLPETLAVYIDGLRMSKGNASDYTIDDDNISILMNRPVSVENKIILEYIPK